MLQLSAVICRKCCCCCCSKQSPHNTTASPSSKGLHLRNGSELNLRSDCRQAVGQTGKHFSAQKVLMMDAVSDPAAPAHSVTHSIDHNITGKCVCGCQWQSAPVNSCSSNLSWVSIHSSPVTRARENRVSEKHSLGNSFSRKKTPRLHQLDLLYFTHFLLFVAHFLPTRDHITSPFAMSLVSSSSSWDTLACLLSLSSILQSTANVK